ncbi:MAG: hypothetical protein PHD79_08470 [Aliarcobacter sp.]|nr:hypothetical protein [Aliarcobacter sp.]
MKYLFLMIMLFTSSMIANPLSNANYTKNKNSCISSDANACNELGKAHLDNLNEKNANFFAGVLFHQKACKIGNEESCKILNDLKSKNLTSLFSENEIKIFKSLIKDEVSFTFRENTNSSMLNEYYTPKKEHISISSNIIQLDYEKNEVGADLKYKDKDIVVSGQVLKISKDAFNSIYLDLKGGTNQFITPKAYIKKDYIEWASKLSKNDNIKLYCEKSSMVMGSAILNDCAPIDIVIEERTNIILDAIDKNALKKSNNKFFQMGVMIKELSKHLKPNSSCYTTNDANKCISEINPIINQINKEVKEMVLPLSKD